MDEWLLAAVSDQALVTWAVLLTCTVTWIRSARVGETARCQCPTTCCMLLDRATATSPHTYSSHTTVSPVCMIDVLSLSLCVCVCVQYHVVLVKQNAFSWSINYRYNQWINQWKHVYIMTRVAVESWNMFHNYLVGALTIWTFPQYYYRRVNTSSLLLLLLFFFVIVCCSLQDAEQSWLRRLSCYLFCQFSQQQTML